ncbi:MAG: cobalt-precorrin 5A hydrolase [Pyramidobacter sp.]|jgi:cobalt-precorrin 5A hydrolase
MRLHILAFTADGVALAEKISAVLGGTLWAPAKYAGGAVLPLDMPLSCWAEKHFDDSDAIIFISACGIAVRAVAPCLKDKAHDPAVICLDDHGRHVISLLSGHLGGANELAVKTAAITGGVPVITTATDVHGVTAVDVWAKAHDCAIENVEAIKHVSSAALEGRPIGVAVTEQLQPAPWPVTLWLRPKNLVLGAGCKKNTPLEALRDALRDFLRGAGVSALSLRKLASIDLKADEPALNALAAELKIPFETSSASQLSRLRGRFSASEKVLAVTGVDNVCERAAVLASGGGPLLRGKTVYPGITLALARIPVASQKNSSKVEWNMCAEKNEDRP